MHADCECNAHGPAPGDVAKVGNLRDTAMLIGSIAIRPCTGAIFFLVIAWQMDIRLAGAVAVMVMGLGTTALTNLVAVSSIAAWGMTFASAGRIGAVAIALPVLQILAGVFVFWMSLTFLGFAVL